ncbi:Transmembrane protein 205 [Rhynchospora pubera]|uniref:Transmembrane protein 205 n=1 Tax=Rhynchospora pubera TaxID=906938 RepID=A0AAV8GW33_9POAL|nr:Transmembrane protein 205 [Rhynchospora pubera]
MMNLLAFGLVLSTLTAAGVLTPPLNPPHHSHSQSGSDQVLREGHRVIVLEYEREVPADTGTGNGEGEHRIKALSESTKDKICDAYGVCRDKLSGAASEVEHVIRGAKDKLSGLFHHSKDKLSDAEETVKESVKGTKDKVLEAKDAAEDKLFQAKEATKDKVSDAKDASKEKVFQAKDATKEKLSHAKGFTKDKLSQASEKTADMISEAKEAAKDKLSQTKEAAEDKLHEAKEKIGDVLPNAEKRREKLFEMKEEIRGKASHFKEGIKETAEKAGDIAEETAQNLTDIVRRARDVAYDMASYVARPKTGRAMWAVAQMLGFATAYGTCVWVTFIASHVLVSVLPRQQFGMVQSKVYPVYFRAVAYGIAVAFVAQFFGRGRGSLVEKLQAYNLLGALGMVLVNMLFLEPTATKVMFERMKAEKEEGRGRDMSDMVEPVMTATPTAAVSGVASVTTTTTTATTAPVGSGSFGNVKTTSQSEMHNEETAGEIKLRNLSIRLRRWNSYSSLSNVLALMSLTWHLVHLARLMACCD